MWEKLNKYNISIEREALRCNSKNKITSAAYPKSFGKKEKNYYRTKTRKKRSKFVNKRQNRKNHF